MSRLNLESVFPVTENKEERGNIKNMNGRRGTLSMKLRRNENSEEIEDEKMERKLRTKKWREN